MDYFKMIKMEKTRVVFSYQGAFAPPHLGHFDSASTYIKELKKIYSMDEFSIEFIFMPSSNISPKPSLCLETSEQNSSVYLSESDRKIMLEIYVEELKKIHPEIIIYCSTIEFEIGKGAYDDLILNPDSLTDTLNTLGVLRHKYPEAILGLGLGIDNGFSLATWTGIDGWLSPYINLSLILMCDRKPSEFAPPIDISKPNIIRKDVKNHKDIIANIEAFFDSETNLPVQTMFFIYKDNEEEISRIDSIIEKITILDSPREYSSSLIRQIIKTSEKNEDLWSKIIEMCGVQLCEYIRQKNFFIS